MMTAVYAVLSNVTYVGQTRYRGDIYPGRHAAILEADMCAKLKSCCVKTAQPQTMAHAIPTSAAASARPLRRLSVGDGLNPPTETRTLGASR